MVPLLIVFPEAVADASHGFNPLPRIAQFFAETDNLDVDRPVGNGIVVAVHGDDYPVTDRSVDVQIVGLRKKLGDAGQWIETVRGIGYRFREDD